MMPEQEESEGNEEGEGQEEDDKKRK